MTDGAYEQLVEAMRRLQAERETSRERLLAQRALEALENGEATINRDLIIEESIDNLGQAEIRPPMGVFPHWTNFPMYMGPTHAELAAAHERHRGLHDNWDEDYAQYQLKNSLFEFNSPRIDIPSSVKSDFLHMFRRGKKACLIPCDNIYKYQTAVQGMTMCGFYHGPQKCGHFVRCVSRCVDKQLKCKHYSPDRRYDKKVKMTQ